MDIPDNLLYTPKHMWLLIEKNEAWIGITDYMCKFLQDIQFIEVFDKNQSVKRGTYFALIESIGSAVKIQAPLSGKIVGINRELEETPQLLNEAPYVHHIAVLQIQNVDEIQRLISAEQYNNLIGGEIGDKVLNI